MTCQPSMIDVLLDDPNENVRIVAAETLGGLNLEPFSPRERDAVLRALTSALRDPSRTVRQAAGAALERLAQLA